MLYCEILENIEHQKALHVKEWFIKSVVHLLRFASFNVRINHLKPFTWASQVLERLTAQIRLCTLEELEDFFTLHELTSMYNEFAEKWRQIETAANLQWEHCLVFKQEITALQVAAYKLERALRVSSEILPNVQPLDYVSNNFLLSFLGQAQPIQLYAKSKGLKIVSILKRKHRVDTYCCYDVEKQVFLSVKAILLIKEAKSVLQTLKLDEGYGQLIHYNHPNLTRYYGAEIMGESLFLLMEYCESDSLSIMLAEKKRISNEFLFKNICHSIVTGLCFLHSRGVPHGDIQPGNVLHDSKGNFKFADYGDINRQVKTALAKIDLSYFTNTAPFMAPERSKSQDFDVLKADIWSLGCLLSNLVTGCQPWYELEHDYAIICRLGATKYLPEALIDLPISAEGSDSGKSYMVHDPNDQPSAFDLPKSPCLSLKSESQRC